MRRLPHPIVVLTTLVFLAAALTWVVPAGQYERRQDPTTGRQVLVDGTYRPVEARPVGLFGAAVAIPRGFDASAEVIVLIFLVGGALVIIERTGTLARLTGSMAVGLRHRRALAVVIISVVFALLGAVEHLSEEIIPLVPVLLLMGASLGFDAIAIVALTKGSAVVGYSFSPVDPFSTVIAMDLAELPLLSGAWLRLILLTAALALWTLWVALYIRRQGGRPGDIDPAGVQTLDRRHTLMLLLVLLPFALYVFGALRLDWGLSHMSGAFLLAGVAAGLAGGLTISETTETYLDGMKRLLPAAFLVGIARAITVVLEDAGITDTLVYWMVEGLRGVSATVASLGMVVAHGLLRIPIPSSSGRAILTLPILIPFSDAAGISRQVTVLAYQIGGGLSSLLNPTGAALMAILLAAGIPFGKWLRFAIPGVVLAGLVGLAGMLVAARAGL